MLEMYEAGGDQANTVVTQPRLSQLNLPKLAREVLILRTYRAAPVQLLLGTGPTGLHQVQIDNRVRDVGADQLPDVENVT
jgi:hypothetical protein